MEWKTLILLLPAASGVFLLCVSMYNLGLFFENQIDPRTMAGRELPIVLFGFAASLVVLISSLYWVYRKQWRSVLYSIFSPVAFGTCFLIGGELGAAYLNAT